MKTILTIVFLLILAIPSYAQSIEFHDGYFGNKNSESSAIKLKLFDLNLTDSVFLSPVFGYRWSEGQDVLLLGLSTDYDLSGLRFGFTVAAASIWEEHKYTTSETVVKKRCIKRHPVFRRWCLCYKKYKETVVTHHEDQRQLWDFYWDFSLSLLLTKNFYVGSGYYGLIRNNLEDQHGFFVLTGVKF